VKPQRPYLLRALYEWILDSDEVPYVLVDATVDGVQVPQEHVQEGQIVLNIGPNAVRDLNIADGHLMCSGRFSGKHFEICLPMASIRAIYAKDMQQGMVLPEEDLSISDVASDGDSEEALPAGDKPTLRLV
jgi:stringent starvation protein B